MVEIFRANEIFLGNPIFEELFVMLCHCLHLESTSPTVFPIGLVSAGTVHVSAISSKSRLS